jgi:hypothetical protein
MLYHGLFVCGLCTTGESEETGVAAEPTTTFVSSKLTLFAFFLGTTSSSDVTVEPLDISLVTSPAGDEPLGDELECFRADLRGEIDLPGG